MRKPQRSVPPRVRDMPAPRENQSVSAPLVRWVFTWPYRAILAGLYRLHVRAWHLTAASLALTIVAGLLLLRGQRLVPGIVALLSGMCDVFDGGLARARGEEARSGAFLDSVFDRLSDMVLFGCLFWSLSRQGSDLEAALALATLVISLMVSHVRAEVESMGATLSEGVFQRLERVVVMCVGLIVPGALLASLVLLCALGSVTVLQRGWSAWRRLGGATEG
jgi:phosphatidylglycerophosphate synthase